MSGQSATEPGSQAYNSRRGVVSGVSWAVLMRWTIRFIGLFSTLVLARLLSPDDFGVVAMGMLLLHFLFEISEFGTAMYLIRAKEVDRSHCDTAWTITLLQGVGVAALLAMLAGSFASYFGEQRVVAVIYALAFSALIGGFENIGPVLLRRELKFSMDFRFNVYKKILVFLATVGSAIVLRSYWALVVGHIMGTVAGVAFSYRVHSYRPRLSLAHAGEYLRFAFAIIPLRTGTTLRKMIPGFLVAGTGNTAALGSYRVSGDIAGLFTSEVVTPMGRGLLPNYSRLASDPAELSRVYRKVLGMVVLACIPIGTGVSLVSEDLTLLLLGDQWGFAAKLMRYLAIGAAVYAVSQAMVNQILVATGREKSAAVLAWVRLGISLPIFWLGMQLGDVTGLAQSVIVAGLVCFPFIYYETRRAVSLPLTALCGLLWRPLAGAVSMWLVVESSDLSHIDWTALRLILDVTIGACTFAVVTFALWLASGKPSSAEAIVLSTVTGVIRSIRQRVLSRRLRD